MRLSCLSIYKNKGDKANSRNNRSISLLNVAGKIFAKIMLTRLLNHFVDRILPESKCGFRADRSTLDMIFAARLLLEKTSEQRQPVSFDFIGFSKAFDTVNRTCCGQLWKTSNVHPSFLRYFASYVLI